MNDLITHLEDPKFYLESFCKIKGKTSGLMPFILNEAQKDIFNAMKDSYRVMVLKARQIGFSTAITGYFYHKTITTPGTNTAIIGYNSDLTAELLDKVKTFYNTTPDDLKPTIHYNSKYEISFPKIDSKIIVLPSTENVGRGYTLHNVLATELAFWEKPDEKMMALEASVPLDGQIVVESTPNGQGNLYHSMWMADNNGYDKRAYGWWWNYSEEEIDLIKRRLNDPRKFAQEYGLEFLASGRNVFDMDSIKAQEPNILKIGMTSIDPEDSSTTDTVTEVNKLRVYRPAKPGRQYVVGADVAEGVIGGDYSTAIIWDRKTGEEVGFYRGHCPPDKFAALLNARGRVYNNALMVVEVNNHGLTCITALKNLMYPSLFFRPAKFEGIAQSWSEKLGWRTTKVTRPLLIDDFNQALREGVLTIHSRELINELLVFVYDDGNNMVPQSGFHDDCIFGAAIGFQGFKVLSDKKMDQVDYAKHLPSNFAY